jgi:hypothetical protein
MAGPIYLKKRIFYPHLYQNFGISQGLKLISNIQSLISKFIALFQV